MRFAYLILSPPMLYSPLMADTTAFHATDDCQDIFITPLADAITY